MMALPCVRLLFAYLTLFVLWFDPRTVRGGFMVEKVELRFLSDFLSFLFRPPVSAIPLIFRTHSFIHSFIHSFVYDRRSVNKVTDSVVK